jgi:hypothetical protein
MIMSQRLRDEIAIGVCVFLVVVAFVLWMGLQR